MSLDWLKRKIEKGNLDWGNIHTLLLVDAVFYRLKLIFHANWTGHHLSIWNIDTLCIYASFAFYEFICIGNLLL